MMGKGISMKTKTLLNYFVLSTLLIFPMSLKAQDDQALLSLAEDYKEAVATLKVPILQLGYLDNLNGILDEETRTVQTARFLGIQDNLKRMDYQALDQESQYLYQNLDYRLDLHLRRLELENRFRKLVTGQVDSTSGIYHQPLGKEWYQLFLDIWLTENKTPEDLVLFGEAEVLKVSQQIRDVQKRTGFENDAEAFYGHLNDEEFFLTNEAEVIEGYQQRRMTVQQHVSELFNTIDFPTVRIEAFAESNKDTVPGQLFITQETIFRFSFFEDRHNIQDMDFLYLHEAAPGHAFHAQYNQEFPNAPYNLSSIWAYSGFSEGWGAYVEELGEEMGLYQTPWLKMGKLQFDLVRSARVVLDVGVNYYDWDNQRALDYWFAHIQGQDEIAQREIDRVRRWPGQAISYKVGAAKLMELKVLAQNALGADFDIREFHHRVLAFGGVPLFLVEKRILDYIESV
jgi:uncharacterized protein (DUF885 family)